MLRKALYVGATRLNLRPSEPHSDALARLSHAPYFVMSFRGNHLRMLFCCRPGLYHRSNRRCFAALWCLPGRKDARTAPKETNNTAVFIKAIDQTSQSTLLA